MNDAPTDFSFAAPRLSPAALGAVVLAHLAVVALVWVWPATVPPRLGAEPLVVRLIETPAASRAPERLAEPATPPATRVRPPARPAAPAAPREAVARPRLPVPPPAPSPAATSAPEPVRAEPTPVIAPAPMPAPAPSEAPPQASAPEPPPPVTQPRFNADYLDNPKPPYPALSRRMGEEGEVRLRVRVDAAGTAAQVELYRSSGFPRLDESALDTVRRWRFVPARQGDQPVPASVIVPIQFSLRS